MVNLANSLLEIAKPTGLWETIIYWIDSFAGNYGWTIILFTILIKLVLSPLDFYNKYSTRKNTLIQKRLAPQVQKLNKKYANNKDVCNQQVSNLYKSEGYNMIGSCIFMLINLVLTLVIFFTIFDSLRTISAYKMLDEYKTLENVYNVTLEQTGDIKTAQDEVLNTYENTTSKEAEFLWIKSIWISDGVNSPVPTYENLKKEVSASKNKTYIEYVNTIADNYNNVTASMQSKYTKWNGYYILAVIALITSFLSQYVSDLGNGVNNKKDKAIANPNANTGKIMKITMPLVMVLFVIFNTSSFGLYIVASSIMSTIISIITNIIVKKMTKKEEEKYLKFLEKVVIDDTKETVTTPTMKIYKKLGE